MGPLNQYLRDVADRPFQWGSHDCLTFTNEAWRVMYGYGWADDCLGRYMIDTPYGRRPMRKDQLRIEFDCHAITEAIDARLKRLTVTIPPRGALVGTEANTAGTLEYALGICLGMKCAFLSRSGVIYKPVTDVARAWL